MLDTAREVPTPEGIELPLRIAGPVSRALAWIIDAVVRIVLFSGLSIVVSVLGKLGIALMLLLWFALEWLYPTVFEVWYGGSTPGKKSLGLVVLHDDGTPVRLPASFTRNLLRAIDFFPALYGVGLISMLLNRDFKRIGDIAAGTIVVYRDQPVRHSALPAAAPLPPPVPLTLAEQRTVVDFAIRSSTLTEERAEELAQLAPQLAGTGSPALALQRLLGIANFLIGRRT
jgi:uncharacterized RDD family membrane protein YckC